MVCDAVAGVCLASGAAAFLLVHPTEISVSRATAIIDNFIDAFLCKKTTREEAGNLKLGQI